MQKMAGGLVLLTAALLGSAAVCAEPLTIRGGGATFPEAIYRAWGAEYAQKGRAVLNYQASGSSAGLAALREHKVDFAATDVPVSPEELEKNRWLQFPTVVGGVVPVVHLPGIASGTLKLTPEVLAAMLTGSISQWNAPQIAALNPQLTLPAKPIVRVVRADKSGSTNVLAEYLHQTVPAWAASMGKPTDLLNWRGTVLSEKGGAALLSKVQATPYSLGYVSSNSLKGAGAQVGVVLMRNKAGNFVGPDARNIRAAVLAVGAAASDLAKANLLDQQGAHTWPIVTATYIVIPHVPAQAAPATEVLTFFYWALMRGDKAVANSGLVALPQSAQAKAVATFATMHDKNGQMITFKIVM